MKNCYLTFFLAIFCLQSEAQNHPITIHANGRVASMLMTAAEFKHWNDSDDYNNAAYREALVMDIYRKFNDDFDFIFLVSNNATRPPNLTYAGQLIGVSNAISGIGAGIYNQCSSYGSFGRLKSLMALTQNTDMLYGPSLHELMHNWGNFNVNTSCFDPFGPGSGSFDFMPHWGVSGCGGQLGGFDQSTLQTNVSGNPNQYSAGINGHAGFGQFANGGNSVPYSNYELYLMGMIPADSLTTFDVFRNISALDNSTGVFTATTRITYDQTKLITDFGARVPLSVDAPKIFRLLIMVLTPAALSDADFTMYDTQAEQFARPSSDGTSLYNFWEATGGRGQLKVNDLQIAMGVSEANKAALTFSVFPNPVIGPATLSFTAEKAGSYEIVVTDALGRKIYQNAVNATSGLNHIPLEIEGMNAGIYFVMLTSESGSSTEKITVR